MYQQVLTLQVTRAVCQIITGKRIYNNMLITRVRQKTDKENENILLLSIDLTEVLIATTQLVSMGTGTVDQHAFPQQTAPTVNLGNQSLQAAPNFNFLAAP